MSMTKNIGDKDRTYRAIAGVLILLWGISTQNPIALIALVVLATAYFRVCPLYIPMDVDTTKS